MTIKIEASHLDIVDHDEHNDIRVDYSCGQMSVTTDVCLSGVEFEIEADDIDVGSEEELVKIIHSSGLSSERVINLLYQDSSTRVFTEEVVIKAMRDTLSNLRSQVHPL